VLQAAATCSPTFEYVAGYWTSSPTFEYVAGYWTSPRIRHAFARRSRADRQTTVERVLLRPASTHRGRLACAFLCPFARVGDTM
jgi:hypothetical protein